MEKKFISAAELKALYQTEPIKASEAGLMDLLQEQLKDAAKNGLKQVVIEVPKRWEHVDLTTTKKFLKNLGYGAVSFYESGYLASDLFVQPKRFVKLFW